MFLLVETTGQAVLAKANCAYFLRCKGKAKLDFFPMAWVSEHTLAASFLKFISEAPPRPNVQTSELEFGKGSIGGISTSLALCVCVSRSVVSNSLPPCGL